MKRKFLKRVVLLCLVMMVLLTLTVIFVSIYNEQPIDGTSLGVLMGGWCGELLLSLLKRKWEVDDKQSNDTKTEDDVE